VHAVFNGSGGGFMILAILEQVVLYMPLILGAYLSLVLMKIPNLAIESAYVFGAISAAKIGLAYGNSSLEGLLIALLGATGGGMAVGLVAGLLSERAYVSPILAAIMTMGLFHGISQFVIGGTHITLPSEKSALNLLTYVEGYPELCSVGLSVFIITLFFTFFMRTQLGVSCALYGDNSSFLAQYRISTSYVVVAGLAVSNALAGISGYLVAQSNGFVDIGMGAGLPLLCLTALILGRSLIRSRSIISSVPPLCGLALYFMLQHFLLRVGFDLRYFMAVQALVVIVLLVIVTRFGRYSRREIIGI